MHGWVIWASTLLSTSQYMRDATLSYLMSFRTHGIVERGVTRRRCDLNKKTGVRMIVLLRKDLKFRYLTTLLPATISSKPAPVYEPYKWPLASRNCVLGIFVPVPVWIFRSSVFINPCMAYCDWSVDTRILTTTRVGRPDCDTTKERERWVYFIKRKW